MFLGDGASAVSVRGIWRVLVKRSNFGPLDSAAKGMRLPASRTRSSGPLWTVRSASKSGAPAPTVTESRDARPGIRRGAPQSGGVGPVGRAATGLLIGDPHHHPGRSEVT